MKTFMKKTFVLFVMIAVVASVLPLFVNASATQNTLEYEIEDQHYTVVFEDELLEEQKDLIAKHLLGIEVETPVPAGLMCTLFGHKYGDKSTVEVITHKARASAPRCRREFYEVQVCSRCDDMVSTRVGQGYIYCCPAD